MFLDSLSNAYKLTMTKTFCSRSMLQQCCRKVDPCSVFWCRRSLPHAVPGCQTACYKFCNSVYITLFKNVIHTASRNDTLKLLPGSGIGLATNEQVLFVLAICPTGFAIMLSSSQRSVNPKCSMSSKVSNPRLDTFYT